tara:strand:- start:1742 stop:2362 length:621 start_codon:yes stop_codon:yes gene_type:complete
MLKLIFKYYKKDVLRIAMLKIKKITLLLLVSTIYIYTSSAVAGCNFGINLGDKYPERFYEYGGEPFKTRDDKAKKDDVIIDPLRFVYFPATDICGGSSLKDIEIEFTFLYDELASIRMIALNDEKNIPSKKLILMDYAKLNYGNFDTGLIKENFNDFKHWRKNKSLVVYKRLLNPENIWDEEIYITNDKYEEILGQILSGELIVEG